MAASVESTYTDIVTSVFSTPIAFKAWFATAAAILATIPVAFHCIFILGFQTTDARVFAHSLLGSFVYGILAVKLWYVHDRDHPRWPVPLAGGGLFTVLLALLSSSSLLFFTGVRVR